MSKEIYKTIRYRGLDIHILSDDNPFNPRENDNLGRMIIFHKSYELGDKKQEHELDPAAFCDYIKDNNATIVSLPIYLMDHSGISISTNRQRFAAIDHERWDWGQVGFIYTTYGNIVNEFGNVYPETIKMVTNCLEMEAEEYNDYLTGNCWGYQVQSPESDVNLLSCWGFLGDPERNHLLSVAKEDIDTYLIMKVGKHIRYLKSVIKKRVPLIYRKPFYVGESK